MEDDTDEDQRLTELMSLEAIFPELQRLPGDNPLTFELELPVNPAKPVTVTFPAAENKAIDSHELSYLPSVLVRTSLPKGYPAEKPTFAISTAPPWLTQETISRLEADGVRLWEDIGRDLVAFTYIDHVQQAADNVFDMVGASGALEVDPAHKIAVLDHDIKARRAAFEKEMFECGVCLDPKRGTVCHKMLDCGHIFCLQCLQEFYLHAIKEGDLPSVRCLMPSCAKERSAIPSPTGKKRKKPKTSITPNELLQIGIHEDMVRRYVELKYKIELEADKDTIYCPRPWCNGAARSKKHKRPEGLELPDDSEASDDEEKPSEDKDEDGPAYVANLLAICEECGFAFCSRCQQSWHGEFFRCDDKRDKEELSAEEQASLDYLKLHTTPCPTCSAAAQKSNGCNHMICYRCATHFCYLCSAWLDPANPYQHFNKQPNGKVTSCYMRLWELVGGDGADVGYGFAGGARQVIPEPARAPPPRQPPIMNIVPEIEEPEDDSSSDDGGEENQNNAQPAVALEGPLVLRIVPGPQPRRGGGRPVPPAAPQAPAGPQGQVARRGGGRGRGRGAILEGQRGRGLNPRGLRGGLRGENFGQPNVREPFEPGNAHEGRGLDAQQRAWVQRFVQMALNDEEDQDEWDSDEDDDLEFRIL